MKRKNYKRPESASKILWDDSIFKKQKRIPLTYGSARVDHNCSLETIAMLNRLSEIAYNSPITNKPKTMKNKKIITDLEPRGKSVLIQRTAVATNEGGIIIPETSKEPRPVGIVVAVGPECNQDLKDGIGRTCSFNRFANLEIIDGNNNILMMMHDSDVQCWINEDTTILDDSGQKKKRINIDKK